MTITPTLEEVRIGRVELRLREGTEEYLKGYRGAFVTVLVRCDSDESFLAAAAAHLADEGFDILAVEDLSPLSDRRFDMNQLVTDLLARLGDYPVQCTPFHLFRDEDTECRDG